MYAANDEHTAVAEVRPFIRDAVSVAKLKVKKKLRLVDFYYEIDRDASATIEDFLFYLMRLDFNSVNKGEKEEYLVTQYLTLLAQKNGFDGIRFRSSLVDEGTNYVIFDADSCDVCSSKMYVIPRIEYDLVPVLDE